MKPELGMFLGWAYEVNLVISCGFCPLFRNRAGVLRGVKFREPSRGTSPTGQGSLARQKGLPLGAQLDYLQGQLRG